MLEATVQDSEECKTEFLQESGNTPNNDTTTSSASSTDSETESDNNYSIPTIPYQVPISRKRAIGVRMLTLCKEVIIMCVIAAAYAALTTETPPKVSKSPAAYPFFSSDSLVTDWYRGEISNAIEQARASDIAFIMFYAPWDAESQNARKEFEIAAEIMQRYVTFASVNCWQPGSACKKQYGKVYKWPVLIAYPTHGRGIQYNGPIQAMHMVKFLQNMCQPIQMAQTISEALHGHDSIIVGNLNLAPGSREFGVFYSTALRILERDHLRDIGFALLPKKTKDSHLFIYNWNSTLSYRGEWDVEEISNWILKNVHQTAFWVNLLGTKSTTLSNHIQQGPALVLFTPKNPLAESNDYYDLLREVAYEYKNCKGNSMINMRLALIKVERKKNRWRYLKNRENCLGGLSTKQVQTFGNGSFCTNCACSMPIQSDYLSPEALQKNFWRKECQTFLLGEKHSRSVFENQTDTEYPKITGLGCNNNQSLSFITIDSLRYYHFGEKLGLNLRKDKTSVVIIDEKHETHHILEEKTLNSINLRNFIQNFTQSSLQRSFLSLASVGKRKKIVETRRFSVKELTSDTFLATVLKQDKVVVVFYYSKQCAFCSGVSYAFLTAARMLQESGIEFARIDGDINLLPWEYTMESYPTILFFPANRKAESRALPQNIPITVPNLINFILTNLERGQKLKSMWRICMQARFNDEQIKCLASVRSDMLSLIERTLREWRMVDYRRKSQIVHKLQVLRQLHLLIAHNPGKLTTINNYFNKLDERKNSHFSLVNSVKDEL